MACPDPVHAYLDIVGDYLASRGRNPDMVNDEWSGAEALENAFRVADEALRKVERERDAAVARAEQAGRELARVNDELDRARAEAVEAKARAEADRRYSGDPNHAFIEGALWATRHALGQEDRHVAR